MALWKFKNLNKYGHMRTRIIHTPTTQLTIGQGFGPFVGASRFHYESRSPYFGIFTSPLDGKKYLTPDWIEVVEGTTIDDVVYNAPEPKKEKPNEWLFESSSDQGQFYKVRYNGVKYTCNCPGYWRSRGNCKHVKEIRDGKN